SARRGLLDAMDYW
nr:immunoglobulin heavy chain junction region [Mus musculus]